LGAAELFQVTKIAVNCQRIFSFTWLYETRQTAYSICKNTSVQNKTGFLCSLTAVKKNIFGVGNKNLRERRIQGIENVTNHSLTVPELLYALTTVNQIATLGDYFCRKKSVCNI